MPKRVQFTGVCVKQIGPGEMHTYGPATVKQPDEKGGLVEEPIVHQLPSWLADEVIAEGKAVLIEDLDEAPEPEPGCPPEIGIAIPGGKGGDKERPAWRLAEDAENEDARRRHAEKTGQGKLPEEPELKPAEA